MQLNWLLNYQTVAVTIKVLFFHVATAVMLLHTAAVNANTTYGSAMPVASDINIVGSRLFAATCLDIFLCFTSVELDKAVYVVCLFSWKDHWLLWRRQTWTCCRNNCMTRGSTMLLTVKIASLSSSRNSNCLFIKIWNEWLDIYLVLSH